MYLFAYLAGRINYFGRIILTLEANDLAKGVLYRWIITFDEMSIDKLNGKRRLAYIFNPIPD